MPEIANAWISIVPETSKIAPGIKSALGQAEAPAAKTGEMIGSKMSSLMGKTLKAGAVGVGAAAGGVLATSMAKGFKRLDSLDQAQAKMRGLGYDASEVSSLMDSVSQSVKGTAFGLDEAAGSAAKLGAVGVATGQDMDRAMTLTADIAAQAGTGMDDISSIMAKVAGAGKVTGETLAQLDDRATGAGAALAEHLGVSIEEMREKVSAGEVSFEDFQVAMEEHLGGAAQKTGETFKGAFDNMMASTGRLGQKLLDPVFKAAPALFGSVGTAFDAVGEAIAPASEKLGQALIPAMEKLGGVIESKLAPAAGKAAGAVADFIAGLVTDGLDSGLWSKLGDSFGKIAGAAAQAWPSVSNLLGSFGKLSATVSVATWQALVDVLNAIAPLISNVLVPALDKLASAAAEHPGMVQALVTAFLGFNAASRVVGPVGKLAGGLKNLTGAAKIAGGAFKTGKGLTGGLVELMGKANSANPIIAKVGLTIGKMTGGLAKSSMGFSKFAGGISKVASVVGGGLAQAARIAMGAFKGLTAVMMANPVGAIIAGITAIVAGLTWFFTKTETGKQMWASFTQALAAGWEWVKQKMQPVFDWIGTAFNGLKALFVEGNFTSALQTAFGVEEDSAFVRVLFKMRDVGLVVKDFLIQAFQVIKDKWAELNTGFGQFYQTWIAPVWEAFKAAAALLADFLELVWEKVKVGVQALADFFVTHWESIKTGLSAVGEFFSMVWDGVKIGFELLGQALQAVWDGVIKPVFNFLAQAVKAIADVVIPVFQVVIPAAWNFLADIIQSTWNNIIKPTWDLLKSAVGLVADVLTGNFDNIGNRFGELGQAIMNLVQGVFQQAWDILKAAVRAAVDICRGLFDVFKGHVQAMVSAVKGKIDELANGFRQLPGKIKSAFAGAGSWLLDAGKAIIRGLANGIRAAAGMVENAVRAVIPDNLERFVPGLHIGGIVPAFARGGVLPNVPGIPRSKRDPILGWSTERKQPVARVEPGEYIVNRASTRKYLPLLSAINADRVNPKLGDLGGFANLPGYADGGIVGYDELLRFFKGQRVRGQQASRSLEGAPYVFGGSNWGDCSSTQGQGALFTVGKTATRGRFMATMNAASQLASIGWRRGRSPKKDAYEIAFYNGGPGGGHAVGTMFNEAGRSLNIEMGGARGNGQIGGGAAGTASGPYTDHYWHPLKSATAKAAREIAGKIAAGEVASTSNKGITLTSGRSIDWGEASNLASEVTKERKRNASLARWRKGAFDSGGLARGMGFMPKATIKPERVLNPSNTRSFDKIPGVMADVTNKLGMSAEAQGMAARAMNNVESALSNITAKDALALGDKLGLDGITGLFKGAVSAWDDMETSFAAQVDASDAVEQAEKNLADARREYAEAMTEDTELTVKQKRRLDDATKAVEAAKKPGKDGKVDSDKVAKAELKLSRVREDITAEQEKAGKKQSEKALQAAENLAKAESDLSDARSVVAAAAKAAGHAEIAMAIEVAATVIKVIDKIVGAVMQAKAAVADAFASMMSAVAELANMSDKLHDQLLTSQVEAALAQVKMQAAARAMRMAQVDGVRTQLEAVKTVAQAQAAFDAQRKADAKAALSNYEDLSLAFDRWRWATRAGVDEALGAMAQWSDESHALWAELQAAQIGKQIAELEAQRSVTAALFEHRKAALNLESATTSLNIAAAKFAAIAGKSFGYDSVQATVGERYAQLQAEKAKLKAERASVKTWLNPVNWFTSMPASKRRIAQIDEELAGLAKMNEFKALTASQMKELERIQASAGAMGFFGAGDKVDEMIRNSWLGDAGRAVEKAKWQEQLIDAKNAADIAKQNLDAKKLEVDQAKKLEPIDELLDKLKTQQASEKTWAEYWRESDPGVRDALSALAQFQSDAADGMGKPQAVVNIALPAGKSAYSPQEVEDMLEAVSAGQDALDVRVRKLERPARSAAVVAGNRKVVM